jgi:hypothetical protein
LRFIPIDKMEEEGYEKFIPLLKWKVYLNKKIIYNFIGQSSRGNRCPFWLFFVLNGGFLWKRY